MRSFKSKPMLSIVLFLFSPFLNLFLSWLLVVLGRAPPDAELVKLLLLLDTAVGGLSVWVAKVVDSGVDRLDTLFPSVVDGRSGKMPGSANIDDGCCDGAEGTRVAAGKNGHVVVVVVVAVGIKGTLGAEKRLWLMVGNP